MTNEFEIRNSPELRKDVDALLKGPLLSMILASVEDKAKPRGSFEARPYVPYDTLVAEKWHFHRGIQFAIDAIRAFTKPNPSTDEDINPEEEAFVHTLPKEMRDALKAKHKQPSA